MIKRFLVVCVFFLLIVSSIGSLSFGYKLSEKEILIDNSSKPQSLDGPMDSPWPMYCHDVRHTSRSPYSKVSNNGFERWQLSLQGLVWGSPVIDDEGVIYIGAWDFYAVYPNGTIKWQIDISAFSSAATFDVNGILYVGTIWAMPNYLYAIYKNNGTLKWKFQTANDIFSSPVIDEYGSIYFGCLDYNIYALFPNGTLKWRYTTGNYVLSSPAIGDDGTIYCGSNDYNLYALYPNNGTLKWKFPTGYYVRVSPCIADDGTIYCVSRDGYLYAIYPNGTMKWQTYVHAGTSPTIGWDGTIYAGWKDLYAVNPDNGSVKWIFDPGSDIFIEFATPCNSLDGTIYFGTVESGEIIAVNPNGTLKWRKSIGGDISSAPAIGEDGTVYIGDGREDGSLHAFNFVDPYAPETPTIYGLTKGKIGTSYEYKFFSTDPNGDDIYYYIDWGDGSSENWIGPNGSGEDVKVSHIWSKTGTYLIKAQAKDINDLKSDWGTLEVTIPRNRASYYSSLFLRFLNQFPNAFPILRYFVRGR